MPITLSSWATSRSVVSSLNKRSSSQICRGRAPCRLLCNKKYLSIQLIGSMSPWVLPERTLGTVRYTEMYPGNYLICRTVPCLLSTVPWLSLFRPLLMSQYLKYTCTDRQASYLYKVGLEYETVKPRRNFNLYTLMRAILLQISRWSGMRGLKTGYGLE